MDIQIGKEYVFFYSVDDGDAKDLNSLNGHKCVVLSKRNKSDFHVGTDSDVDSIYAECEKHGGLYEVEFDNSSEFDVYGCELDELNNCKESKC